MSNGCVASVKNCMSSVLDPVYRAAYYVDEKISLSQRVHHLYKTVEHASRIPFLGVGISTGLVACLSFGQRKDIGKTSQMALAHFGMALPLMYRSFLGVLSPNMPDEISKLSGSFVEEIIPNLVKKGNGFASSENFFVRHVASRGAYVGAAVVSVVSRVALGAIGLVAALLSFIPYLPYKTQVANLAFQELQGFEVVQDVFYLALKFLNPWTKIRYA